jgi:hypothetical protein
MQHPSHNGKIQGFFNFGQPQPNTNPNQYQTLMTMNQFEEHVLKLNGEPQEQEQQPPQPVPLFQPLLPTQQPPSQPIRGPCMGATGPMQNKGFESGLGNSMSILKKEKENKEVIALLYTELSSIRTQIETLTKATDNIYKIISKFNC